MSADVPDLAGVSGVDVPTLLDAMAAVETSIADTGIRVEASYLPSGFMVAIQGQLVRGTGALYRAEVEAASDAWGCTAAACGVSRWQIQASECWRLGYRGPWLGLLNDEVVLPFVCAKLREIARDMLAHKITPTVELIGEAWNTGSARDSFTNARYQRALRTQYDLRAQGDHA